MKIFIMAQGRGDRWADRSDEVIPVKYKQLLPVGKELLISRTVRQLKGNDVTLVSHKDLISLPIFKNISFLTLREPMEGLLSGIWKTRDYWGSEDILILLGDVVYSNRMIRKILLQSGSPSIFGRNGKNKVTGKEASELFALKFVGGHAGSIRSAIKEHTGRLWDLHGILNTRLIQLGNDYTDDCDSIQEYNEFFNKLEAAALADDEENK